MSLSNLNYEALFDHTPTPYLVLTPDLVVVGMNKAREQVTERRREDVIGQHIFEAFPDPPEDQTATGVQNLRASLERVLATKRPDTMPMQKYDLQDAATGEFIERWWSPVNVPILDDDGEVVLLVHRVTEVTEWMRTRAQRNEALEVSLEETESDLYARAQELHAAWMQASTDVANFRAAMLSQRVIGQAVGLLMAKLNIDGEQAFALLVKESQYQHIKLRDLAHEHVTQHERSHG